MYGGGLKGIGDVMLWLSIFGVIGILASLVGIVWLIVWCVHHIKVI